MKAWLKGGLIGFLAFVIIEVLYIFSCPRCIGNCQPNPVCEIFSFLGYIFGDSIQTTIIFILIIISFIVFGALVGLIIGKIKSKKINHSLSTT